MISQLLTIVTLIFLLLTTVTLFFCAAHYCTSVP